MQGATDETSRSNVDPQLERRVLRTPSKGAKVALVCAALFLVAAAYFLFSPVRVVAADGGSWDCGTALSAPQDTFGKGLCGRINDVFAARAVAFGVAAVVTGVGGILTFGTEQRVETRRRRTAEDDDL